MSIIKTFVAKYRHPSTSLTLAISWGVALQIRHLRDARAEPRHRIERMAI